MNRVNDSSLQWSFPSVGYLKLNVDGGLDVHKGIYGTGAVCRDGSGVCLSVFAVPGTGLISVLIVVSC